MSHTPRASNPDISASEEAAQGAKRALTASLIFSGVRCILMYAVIPFVLPLLGVTGLFAHQVDVVINLAAIAALIYSVRRFWQIDYRGKVAYTVVAAMAFVIIVVFIALDLRALNVIQLSLH
jgi:NADH:ubiquinone oxidoreductase subunit 4 (subunit M)